MTQPSDPTATGRPRLGRFGLVAAVVALVLALAAAALTFPRWHSSGPSTRSVAAPWEFTVSAWQRGLGGDSGLSRDRFAVLDRWEDPALDASDAATLRTLATQVTEADLRGEGRAAFPGYWPPAPASGVAAAHRCVDVDVVAASPAHLPVTSRPAGVRGYAKVLVVWTATCGSTSHTLSDPGVSYAYAKRGARGWQIVRDWTLPAPAAPTRDPQAATEPAAWELKRFGSCGSPASVLRDRIIVVDAFTAMCRAAASDDVRLEVTSAYRTRGEQTQLFNDAVDSYGSEQEARKWVAYADASVCTSRHCSGVALNVKETSAAARWLNQTVGCLATDKTVTAAVSCTEGQTPVPRMARYGFAAPLPSVPSYLEFTLPIESGEDTGALSAPDCAPAGVPVPNQVAAIFRCRLDRGGVLGAEQDRVVAQALVVSRCESGWNAAARAFAGRFAEAPNPADDRLYTHTGVFMLTRELADTGWVPGGTKALTDPVANINAAASLWLATRGWEQFGCATGTNGGFESGPVLPSYGGPRLPAWAHQY